MSAIPDTDVRINAEPIAPEKHVTSNDSPLSERPPTLLERVYGPRVVLFVFTLLNFMIYFDRGAISGCLSSIRVDPKIRGKGLTLSDTRGGAIASVFTVGFMLTCPLFVALGSRLSSKTIILGGMVLWCIACICAAFSQNYWMLLFSRVFVGIGEAGYYSFLVTIIDNIAPKATRTLWLGTYYSMIPVGTAMGMALGGVISDMSFNLPFAAWRTVFIGEVVVMAVIMIMMVLLPSKYNVQSYTEGESYLKLPRATLMLVRNLNFFLVVVGYAMYSFLVNAISTWAIPMLQQGPLHLSVSYGSILVGASTAICGVIGSLIGGVTLDFLGGSTGLEGTAKCQLFDVGMIVISLPCIVVALCAQNLILFIVMFCIGVVFLFAVTAPNTASMLSVVELDVRPYAVSYSVFIISLLGDFPAPTVAGSISDRLDKGCPKLTTAEACDAAAGRKCYWVAGEGDNSSHCANLYQLRNALLIVCVFLCIAIPCWMWLYYRLRVAMRKVVPES